jgi:hypothetical protein
MTTSQQDEITAQQVSSKAANSVEARNNYPISINHPQENHSTPVSALTPDHSIMPFSDMSPVGSQGPQAIFAGTESFTTINHEEYCVGKLIL